MFTISMHESGKTLFPGGGFEDEIGRGLGRGYNVNVPLPSGTYDAAHLKAFHGIVLPLVRSCRPDVIGLELGMDALAGDPLTHLSLTNNTHVEILQRFLEFQLPMLLTGGGGYHLENTVRGRALAWQTLCGDTDDPDLSIGTGGVMLESAEWVGGLRDRVLPVTDEQRHAVDAELQSAMEKLNRLMLTLHGLKPA